MAVYRPPIPSLGCLFSLFLWPKYAARRADSPPAKRASSADSSGYDTDLPDEVQQEAVRRVCGALGLREQYDAAVAAGELLELLESLPRGAVEASIRLMRGYTRTGKWPEPILTSPYPAAARQAPQMSGQMDR